MSLIKKGPVRYYYGNWMDATLQLFGDATLRVDIELKDRHKTETKIFKIGPGKTATHSKLGKSNYPALFVVNTVDESEYTSGPMFATQTEEETEDWIRKINLIRVRSGMATRHQHPLTENIPRGYGSFSTMPKSSYLLFDNKWTCNYCQNLTEYPGTSCEFCDYKLCNDCHAGFKTVSVVTLKSPNHAHELMRFDAARGEMWFTSAYEGVYNCDKCGQTNTGAVYHCVECGTYDECPTCCGEYLRAQQASQSQSGTVKEISLDLSHFAPAFAVDGTKLTQRSSYTKIPQQSSVITNKHWDLSKIETEPVPHAYCEFTLHKFDAKSRVGVGIGNQIFAGNQLLGYQQNSFGYFNSGMLAQNCTKFLEKYLPAFSPGSTIGVGILYDSFNQRRLFFTKDGKMLEYFPAVIHKGMDVFPGISFEKTARIEFTANFTGPFKFDPRTILNYRADTADRLSKIPSEILAQCLYYVSNDPSELLLPRLVSKKFAQEGVNNTIWKPLFLRRWPLQYDKLNLKSWYTLYKRRHPVDKHSLASTDFMSVSNTEPKLIENCSFEFLCPLKWDSLPGTDNDVRHCNKCDKSVYRVDDKKTLDKYAKQGKCVSMFAPPNKSGDIFEPPYPPMMGVPPMPPRMVPPPYPGMQLKAPVPTSFVPRPF